MNRFTKKTSVFATIAVLALFCTGAALAAAGYSLYGDAELVSPGNASPTAAELSSVCPGGPSACFVSGGGFTFSGVDFTIPAGMTVNDLLNLSTDTQYTAGGCGGGSPRFQVNVTNGINSGNIFVYLGAPPSYNGCALFAWTSSGNLVTPISLVDTQQLPGGAFYDPYASAQIKYGTYQITGIQIVADGGWAVPGNNQTVQVDNVAINNQVTTFESADSCKKGGWEQFTSAPGPFKNQGQCVSYFAKGGQ